MNGRTTMERLYAVGETCCNGVHGANRLASNSLLESLLFAKRAAEDMARNYSKIDLNAARKIAGALDMGRYADPTELLEEYRKLLKKAIKEAEDAKPRFGRA